MYIHNAYNIFIKVPSGLYLEWTEAKYEFININKLDCLFIPCIFIFAYKLKELSKSEN